MFLAASSPLLSGAEQHHVGPECMIPANILVQLSQLKLTLRGDGVNYTSVTRNVVADT